jgi:Asp-tRNA(Asn)/Glu-tRNA(Gln) amidotransferase A subunit family amidase
MLMLDSPSVLSGSHNLSDLCFLSLAEMAESIRRRKISPVELTEAHLQRIERLNPRLNAFVHVDAEGALARAKLAETEMVRKSTSGDSGALRGVPISLKSSLDVAGFPCECGTRLRKGNTPHEDATLVARLRAAGAVFLGNTNVPEFLMAYETDNSLYGRTNNPWDLARTPGGSSGGESAAIASGCAAAGIGSDGGGSIRIPAHYTGICGLKPTPGRVPSTGHYPPSAGPFTELGVVGPMARTIRDVDTIFRVIAGYDPDDPASAPVPLRDWSMQNLRRISVAYMEDDVTAPATPETTAAVRRAAEALREQGFEVVPSEFAGFDRIWKLWWTLFGRGIQLAMEGTVAGREAELSPMYRAFRKLVDSEPALTSQELLDTLLQRDALRNAFLSKMEHFPILLCPVCAVPAFRHGEREWTVQGKQVKYLKAMSYSQWFNLLGNPTVVIPVGQSPEGLPIGVQIVGRPWEDEAVLEIAALVESACGGFRRPPLD